MARLTLVKVRLVWWELCFLGWGLELRVMWVGVKLKNCAILKKIVQSKRFQPPCGRFASAGMLKMWRRKILSQLKIFPNNVHTMYRSHQNRPGQNLFSFFTRKKGNLFLFFFFILFSKDTFVLMYSERCEGEKVDRASFKFDLNSPQTLH